MTDITDLCRPIIGIENRTAQEAFDIMADRIRAALSRPIDPKEEEETRARQLLAEHYRRCEDEVMARDVMSENWRDGASQGELSVLRSIMDALASPSIVAPVGVEPLDIDWKAMYLAARAAQLKTGGSDEYEAGHFADKANQAILSALTPAEKAGWLYDNEDTGREYSDNHPVESGEVPDATNIVPATAENLLAELKLSWRAWNDDREEINRLRDQPTAEKACVGDGEIQRCMKAVSDVSAKWVTDGNPDLQRALGEAIEAIRALSTTKPAQGDGEAVADQIIGQIEDRFPNWRSYRDLIDCIDCTLHELRKGSRS